MIEYRVFMIKVVFFSVKRQRIYMFYLFILLLFFFSTIEEGEVPVTRGFSE